MAEWILLARLSGMTSTGFPPESGAEALFPAGATKRAGNAALAGLAFPASGRQYA